MNGLGQQLLWDVAESQIADRRAEADRRRLVRQHSAAGPGMARLAVARVGNELVRLGERLERVGAGCETRPDAGALRLDGPATS